MAKAVPDRKVLEDVVEVVLAALAERQPRPRRTRPRTR